MAELLLQDASAPRRRAWWPLAGAAAITLAIVAFAVLPRLDALPHLNIARSWLVAALLATLTWRRGFASRWTIAAAGSLIGFGVIGFAPAWVGLAAGLLSWSLRWLGTGSAPARSPAFASEWRDRAGDSAARTLWMGITTILRPDLRSEAPAAAAILAAEQRRRFIAGLLAGLLARQLILFATAAGVAVAIFRLPGHAPTPALAGFTLLAAGAGVGLTNHLLTLPGRRLLRARLVRITRFEFWPTWVVYLLLLPTYVRCTLRTGHPLAFTACNPGIENGGGIVGENKFRIMRTLRDSAAAAGLPDDLVRAVCRTELIPEGHPSSRAAAWHALVVDSKSGITSPTILKPISGERGFSVRKVSSHQEAERYFEIMPRAALVQPWHPGPGEVGVLWMRTDVVKGSGDPLTDEHKERRRGLEDHAEDLRQEIPQSSSATLCENLGGLCASIATVSVGESPKATPAPTEIDANEVRGRIFSITHKQFASLTGDGRDTVEELIWRHPRYRLQARVFLDRLAGQRLRVLAPGEQLAIGVAGNHCQGATFRDGAHLITPALEAAVDRLACAFPGGTGGGLDSIRIDIRYRSEGDLIAGRLDPDSIVEINGTTGESTNIYDPDKPIAWSLAVLRAQWRGLYALGRERMGQGLRPLSVRAMARLLLRNRGRAGSSLSD